MRCEHRNNKLIEVKESKDGRKRYFFECNLCDAKWVKWGCKPRDRKTKYDLPVEMFM